MTAATKKSTVRRSPKAAAKPTQSEQAITAAEDAIAELQAMPEDESPIGPDGEIRPVVIGKKGKKGTEMVHIFTLDDVEYSVPRNLGPARILAFQRDLLRVDRDTAVFNLSLNVLGQKALTALAESPDTDEEDLAKVFTIIAALAFGSLKKIREATDPS